MNKHCDWVSIDKAYRLMEILGIEHKGEFASLCGVTHRQFNNWERKGKMPQYQLSTVQKEIISKAKKRFDDIVKKVLELDNEE